MRILFVGGLYRGYRLAQRLLERGEDVVGAFVYEEDAHEDPKYSQQIAAQFAARKVWVQTTRKITRNELSLIRDCLVPDVIFCLGWRTLIPMDVIQSAPLGGIAVHDSLLPRLRGFAPTNWGMILGYDQLGATLFQLTDSVDAGDIYFQQAIRPESDESYESIQQRIADVSVRLFEQYLDVARSGTPVGRPQNHADATYTCARSPADGEIDWHDSSTNIARLIRALGPPAPGAFTYFRGSKLTIVAADAVGNPRNYEGRIPGRMVDRDAASGWVDVLCGEGVLRIERVRTADGGEQSAASVVRSFRESLGLNPSQAIFELTERVARLEAQISSQHGAPFAKKAG